MGDILEDSWAYQEMVQKAVAKATAKSEKEAKDAIAKAAQAQKDMEQLVISFVETHFPGLIPLAKERTKQAKTSKQLQKMLGKLFIAHTDDEAKTALLE